MINTDLLPILKALAHETRFKMVELLLRRNLCVGALAKHLEISEAAASQHLQILRKAALVKGEKIGYWTHYAVQTDKLQELGERLSELAKQAKGLQDLPLEPCPKINSDSNKGGK